MEFKFSSRLEADLIPRWESFVKSQRAGCLFQMPFWADFFDPKTHRTLYFWGEEKGEIRITALIRGRKIPLLGVDFFILRGPVCDDKNLLKEGIMHIVRILEKEKGLRLRVNPYWEYPPGEQIESGLRELGFEMSQGKDDIHYQTVAIDLARPSVDIFQRCRKTVRYEIKRSRKLGLMVEIAESEKDINRFYELLTKMSERKRMPIPPASFFSKLWRTILKEGSLGILLMSYFKNHLVSGIIILKHSERAVYTWGASDMDFAEKVSKSYLAIWEGILWGKSQGCRLFDMGGYAGPVKGNPEMEHIDYFKSGFGGDFYQLVKVHQYFFQPWKERWVQPFLP